MRFSSIFVCLGILFITYQANASFYKWKYRAHRTFKNGSPENLIKSSKTLHDDIEVPDFGVTVIGADWVCVIEPSKGISARSFGDTFLESRSLECKHSSGASETQITTCSYDKNKKKFFGRGSEEVNLEYKNESIYVELICDM